MIITISCPSDNQNSHNPKQRLIESITLFFFFFQENKKRNKKKKLNLFFPHCSSYRTPSLLLLLLLFFFFFFLSNLCCRCMQGSQYCFDLHISFYILPLSLFSSSYNLVAMLPLVAEYRLTLLLLLFLSFYLVFLRVNCKIHP